LVLTLVRMMKRSLLLLICGVVWGGAAQAGPSLPEPKPEIPVPDPKIKPGFVKSPYSDKGLIDVRGFPPGTKVQCPYTGKQFLVPKAGVQMGIPVEEKK